MPFYPCVLDIDEWLRNPCHANANCNDTIVSDICTCARGFMAIALTSAVSIQFISDPGIDYTVYLRSC